MLINYTQNKMTAKKRVSTKQHKKNCYPNENKKNQQILK